MYTMKIGPDGWVDCLKARLVAKGYTQVYGFDYYDTFSLVAKIASIHLLLLMAAMQSWPLYQPSYMATWQRRSIWSNHLGLLLKGSLDWYAGYAAHYMA